MKEGHKRVIAGLVPSFKGSALLARRSLSSYKWKPLLEGNRAGHRSVDLGPIFLKSQLHQKISHQAHWTESNRRL